MSNICRELHLLFASLKIHAFPFDDKQIPLDGIYILFEAGELGHGTNRIVRVGTHTGKGQLRSRLKQHFIRENKDRSIFRKNIGRAILTRENDQFLQQWELDLTTRKSRDLFRNTIDFVKQARIEKIVSDYIQHSFQFVAFQVRDKITRLDFESKIISTISRCEECSPSVNWLGQFSPKQKIQKSGLWLVNELYKEPMTDIELEVLLTYLKPI